MIRLYLVSMFLIPLLEGFDRWFERHAPRYDIGCMWPDSVFAWGILENVWMGTCNQHLRFIRIRLPIKTYGPVPYWHYEFSFRDHYLQWVEGNLPDCGWRIEPPLGD